MANWVLSISRLRSGLERELVRHFAGGEIGKSLSGKRLQA
jgi:hypothetical protein